MLKTKAACVVFFWWLHHFRVRVSWTSELVTISAEKLLSGMAEGKSLSTAALKSVFTMCGLGGGGEKTKCSDVLPHEGYLQIWLPMHPPSSWREKSVTIQEPDVICNGSMWRWLYLVSIASGKFLCFGHNRSPKARTKYKPPGLRACRILSHS